MKRTIPSKNKRKTRSRNTQHLEVDADTVKTLRTVGDQEAFHFYEAIGKPTGTMARSLSDFLDKVNSVKQESLTFHLQRRDFQNWVEKIFGDTRLSRELEEISSSNSDDIRTKIHETVENRIKELKESTAPILVDQNSAVILSSS